MIINLPVWRDKYDAQVRESIAQRLTLARKREAAHNELSTRLAQAHFDYIDAQRRAELYEITLIPKATESIQSTLASFRTGSSSFTDLLDAQRTLLEFELSAIRSRAAKGRALACSSTCDSTAASPAPAPRQAPRRASAPGSPRCAG